MPAGCWTSRFKRVDVPGRQIRRAKSRRVNEGGLAHPKRQIPCFQEKPLSFSRWLTVPQTDTGGRAEYAQALERTRVKELGKLTP